MAGKNGSKKAVQKKKVERKSRKSNGNVRTSCHMQKVRLVSPGSNWVGGSQPLQNYLIAPDVFGPCRIPRSGGSSKTGLGLDRTIFSLIGNSTNAVQAVALNPSYTYGCSTFAATNAGNYLGSQSNNPPGVQFPLTTSIDDIAFVAGCITVSYLGAPLNAAGEIVIGTVSADTQPLTSTSYNTLCYYPGFIRVPVASLIENPLRCFAMKTSPASDTFISTNASVQDLMRPIVVINNVPIGGTVQVEITRTWEYHSSSSLSNVVPYEIQGSGLSADVANYTDTMAELGNIPVAVEPAFAEYAREFAMGVAGNLMSAAAPAATQFATSILRGVGNRYMARLTNG